MRGCCPKLQSLSCSSCSSTYLQIRVCCWTDILPAAGWQHQQLQDPVFQDLVQYPTLSFLQQQPRLLFWLNRAEKRLAAQGHLQQCIHKSVRLLVTSSVAKRQTVLATLNTAKKRGKHLSEVNSCEIKLCQSSPTLQR